MQSWRKSPGGMRPLSLYRGERESPAPEHSPLTQKESSRAHTPGSPARGAPRVREPCHGMAPAQHTAVDNFPLAD